MKYLLHENERFGIEKKILKGTDDKEEAIFSSLAEL